MKTTVSIVFKSFQPQADVVLKAHTISLDQSVTNTHTCAHKLKPNPFLRLPTSQHLYTVLRSPHIDKKSREQFAMKVHKQLIQAHTNRKHLHQMLVDLRLQNFRGVAVKVTFGYKTRLNG